MRAVFWLLVGLLLGGSITAAHATYATGAAPATWGGGPGAWTNSTAAANASQFFPGGMRGPGAVLNVGGRPVVMPAAYRFAANSGRFAAKALFLNPAWAVGTAVATWIAGECIGVIDGEWHVTCGPGTGTLSDGYGYYITGREAGTWSASAAEACSAYGADLFLQENPYRTVVSAVASTWGTQKCAVTFICNEGPTAGQTYSCGGKPVGYQGTSYYDVARKTTGACPAGSYWVSGGCSPTPASYPADEDDVVAPLENKPYPVLLPHEMPYPWPVDPPVMNPTPGDDPQSQPMRVPTGNPVPIPGTDPQEYRQPVTRLVPAPTPDSPWRVDVQPEDIQSTDPVGITDPQTVPPEEPLAAPPENRDFCAEHPDVLACQKLDQVDDVDLSDTQIPVAITPDAGWGPSTASCPAPRSLSAQGQSVQWSWSLYCDFATGVRPLFIGFAWLTAALMLVGVLSKK